MKTFKSSRPVHCIVCTRPVRKRTVSCWVKTNPGYAGHSSDHIKTIIVDKLPTSKAECQRMVNSGEVVSVRRDVEGGIDHFTTWDGESYEDQFFCTGSCAKRFGYICAEAGQATKKYNEFMRAKAAKSK